MLNYLTAGSPVSTWRAQLLITALHFSSHQFSLFLSESLIHSLALPPSFLQSVKAHSVLALRGLRKCSPALLKIDLLKAIIIRLSPPLPFLLGRNFPIKDPPPTPTPTHTPLSSHLSSAAFQTKYKEAGKKEISSSHYSQLPVTMETQHAKDVSQILSEVDKQTPPSQQKVDSENRAFNQEWTDSCTQAVETSTSHMFRDCGDY